MSEWSGEVGERILKLYNPGTRAEHGLFRDKTAERAFLLRGTNRVLTWSQEHG